MIKAISKYRNHPSILQRNCPNSKLSFSFTEKKKDIVEEIKNLQVSKAMQHSDTSTKRVEDNPDLFADFIFTNLNYSIAHSTFPTLLKLPNITPEHKKDLKTTKYY